MMQSSHSSPKRRLSRRSFARLFSLAISNAKRHPRSVAVGLLASILLSLVVGLPAVGYGARSDWTTAIKVRGTDLARSVKEIGKSALTAVSPAAVSPAAVTTKPPNMAPPADDGVTVPTTISTGSYIIDMGQATQTVANGLKPFGLIYDLVINSKVPISWAINPAKVYGGTDFTYNAKNYIGGPFIIPAEFVTAGVVTTINTWKAKGVVVDGPTVSAILNVPVYDTITSFPKTVINTANSGIAGNFYHDAEIPAAAYRNALPAGLTACDDIFAMPHADPTWLLHNSLITFVNGGGFVWAGCHAVSVLESIDDPGDVDTFPNINFLSTNGLAHYNINPQHADGTVPYTKDPTLAGHPIMQYLGATDAAHQNGSEQIYLTDTTGPHNWGSVWRPTTKVAVYDSDHVNAPGGSGIDITTDKAAALVFGRGFGSPTAGFVMYEGGHDIGGNAAANVAAQRAYFNMILLAGIHFRPELTVNVPATIVNGRTYQLTASVTGGTPAFTYLWTSGCGGTFSPNATTQNPLFTAPTGAVTACTLKVTVTDSCGRTNFTASAQDVAAASAVDLATFDAYSLGDSVFVEWSTGFEADNLGFNLYREVGGKRYQVTPSLIAGSALMVGAGIRLEAGLSYAWRDDFAHRGSNNAQYWLEELDLNGASTWHGPFSVVSGESLPLEKRQLLATRPRALRLSEVADRLGAIGRTQPVEPRAELVSTAGGTSAAGASAGTRSVTRTAANDLADQIAIKIEVKRAGSYRVSQPELIAAGLNSAIDPRRLQLYVDGEQLPILVTGEQDGKFDSGDAVEFYGIGVDIPSTDGRVYWLTVGKTAGQRVPLSLVAGGVPTGPSFSYKVEREDRVVYVSAILNGDADNFFGPPISSVNRIQRQTLTAANVYTEATGGATLEVTLQGVTAHQHAVKVTLNGVTLGTISFSGQERGFERYEVANSLLVAGDNIVELEKQSGDPDVSLVDSLRLTYEHSWQADGNALLVTAQAGQLVSIGGFSLPNVRVVDVTDPDKVSELNVVATQLQGSYTATAAVAGTGARWLYAFASDVAKTAASVKSNAASSWKKADNRADLLVIAHGSLIPSVQPLVELRRSQGLKVAVVDVEDIYDEFSFGMKTTEAIRDFISYAATSWRTKPKALLLFGKGTYDPRSYLGQGDADLVPTQLIETRTMESAVDDSLADFNDDGVAELTVGRLPVRTPAEATAMVAKILAYQGSAPTNRVTLFSDIGDTWPFEAMNDQVRSVLPAGLEVDQIYRSRLGDTVARTKLLEALNRGQKVVNYVGHGSITLWRGNMLTVNDAPGLQNGNSLALYVMMTCLNGYFVSPLGASLSESLLRSNGGAVAAWASSGTTTPEGQSVMNVAAMQQLFSGQNLTIGEAARAAKAAVADIDVRRTWNLLGDPTMKLK